MLHIRAAFPINSPANLPSFPMNSRFLAPFVLSILTETTLAQTATLATASPTSAHATVDVWPEGKMPGKGANAPEAEVPRDDGFHRITNVSRPTLTLFPTPRKAGAAAAMIVCPGGGYGYTVIDKQGTEIAVWLPAGRTGRDGLVPGWQTRPRKSG